MRSIELLELSDASTEAIIKKMKKYANSYGLIFRVISADDEEVHVTISQVNPDSPKIFDRDEMHEIAHDVFDESLLPSQHLKIAANTIEPPPAKGVDVEWIKRRMYQTSTKLKVMTKDLGLAKNGLDEYLSGTKALNKMEKALFYYYLEYRSLLKNFDKDQEADQ